jgi:hypothetical protein
MTYLPSSLDSNPLTRDNKVDSGRLLNSTRTPKDFSLDKLEAFQKAGYYLNYEGTPSETFDHWLNQAIAGYLLSRLYNGGYHEDNLIQDFTFQYIPRSWAALEVHRRRHSSSPSYILNSEGSIPEFTVFNSSSFANQSLSR